MKLVARHAVPPKESSFFHTHLHTQFSTIDGTADARLIVQKTYRQGDPAVAFTDHGSMAGVVKGYTEAKKLGMLFYPGFEGYLIDPMRDDWAAPAKGAPTVDRYHFGLMALNEDGYIALVKFISMTHTRPRFSRFPRCTLSDLVNLGNEHGSNIVLTTGCYFGLIQQNIARGREELVDRYLDVLRDAFPHMFVEVQNHHICFSDQEFDPELLPLDDVDITNILIDKSDEFGLPVIAAQDSHYLDMKHKAAHSLMKKMVYGGADDAFPGDSFHVASGEWVAEHYTQKQWDRFEDGYAELLRLNTLSISPLDNYKPRVPNIMKKPFTHIKKLCEEALSKYLRKAKAGYRRNQYTERMLHELDVIRQLGMASYFVITQDMVRWCAEKHYCFEARGSANGSLVCFLLGITQVDPVIHGGLFERFLSTDRIKPPDVDMDIEDEARPYLMAYLLKKYGAVQIGTYGLLGITTDDETGEQKGSVLQTWLSYKRQQCAKVAKERKDKVADQTAYARAIFQRTYGDVKGIEDVARHSEEEYEGLLQLADLNSVYRSYGTHAGGVLLSGDDVKIENYIPTMLVASSDTRVSQYNMDDVEAFGLLKMDVLGQSSLRTMRVCQSLIGRKDPADFTWIDHDDDDVFPLLRDGRTGTGIFHFEGYTKAKGGREMKVRSLEDAIMVHALYMPGAMDSGQKDKYIKRRFSGRERRGITYISPEFEAALERTYGTVIFQDQVIEIMRNLGMDIEGINKFFKVVKDSGRGSGARNQQRLKDIKTQFTRLCIRKGITDTEAAWAQTAGFVSYGFNRAHASGYGIRSYRTAYLKHHYPTEFMTALLQTWAGRKTKKGNRTIDREAEYAREARRIGLRVLPPDVNHSGATWTMQREGVIRRGLLSIPGIGDAKAIALEANAPYRSVEDMIDRLNGRELTGGKKYLEDGEWSGTLLALKNAGALESLGIEGL